MTTAGELIHLSTSCEERGICKEVPVVDVHLINAKGSKLIEPDKAESYAMMVMSDDPKLTNFEKRYKDQFRFF